MSELRTFPCGCRARTAPSGDGGLIVYEFYPVCEAGRRMGTSIAAVRAHFGQQAGR